MLGAASPRILYYMAKVEAHRVPGLGAFIRTFGCFPVRRGESDREAVRTMRRIVAEGHALGLFVEGTRQRSGVPGQVQPGAAMVALQEDVPIVPVAIHGTQGWKPAPGGFQAGVDRLGRADDVRRAAEGRHAATRRRRRSSQTEIRRLFDWLVDVHTLGRPRRRPSRRATA